MTEWREELTRPRDNRALDVLVRVAAAVALVIAAALASPEAGAAMLVAVVAVGVGTGGVSVRRAAYVIVGLAITAGAVALTTGDGFTETDEWVFALVLLGVGLFNILAGLIYARATRATALAADALLVGFMLWLLSTIQIG